MDSSSPWWRNFPQRFDQEDYEETWQRVMGKYKDRPRYFEGQPSVYDQSIYTPRTFPEYYDNTYVNTSAVLSSKASSVATYEGHRKNKNFFQKKCLVCMIGWFIAVVFIVAVAMILVFFLNKNDNSVKVMVDATKVNFTVKVVNREFTDKMSDSNSEDFSRIAEPFCSEIDRVYLTSSLSDVYYGCSVLSLTNGSINIEYTVLYHGWLDSSKIADVSSIFDTNTAKVKVDGVEFKKLEELLIEHEPVKPPEALQTKIPQFPVKPKLTTGGRVTTTGTPTNVYRVSVLEWLPGGAAVYLNSSKKYSRTFSINATLTNLEPSSLQISPSLMHTKTLQTVKQSLTGTEIVVDNFSFRPLLLETPTLLPFRSPSSASQSTTYTNPYSLISPSVPVTPQTQFKQGSSFSFQGAAPFQPSPLTRITVPQINTQSLSVSDISIHRLLLQNSTLSNLISPSSATQHTDAMLYSVIPQPLPATSQPQITKFHPTQSLSSSLKTSTSSNHESDELVKHSDNATTIHKNTPPDNYLSSIVSHAQLAVPSQFNQITSSLPTFSFPTQSVKSRVPLLTSLPPFENTPSSSTVSEILTTVPLSPQYTARLPPTSLLLNTSTDLKYITPSSTTQIQISPQSTRHASLNLQPEAHSIESSFLLNQNLSISPPSNTLLETVESQYLSPSLFLTNNYETFNRVRTSVNTQPLLPMTTLQPPMALGTMMRQHNVSSSAQPMNTTVDYEILLTPPTNFSFLSSVNTPLYLLTKSFTSLSVVTLMAPMVEHETAEVPDQVIASTPAITVIETRVPSPFSPPWFNHTASVSNLTATRQIVAETTTPITAAPRYSNSTTLRPQSTIPTEIINNDTAPDLVTEIIKPASIHLYVPLSIVENQPLEEPITCESNMGSALGTIRWFFRNPHFPTSFEMTKYSKNDVVIVDGIKLMTSYIEFTPRMSQNASHIICVVENRDFPDLNLQKSALIIVIPESSCPGRGNFELAAHPYDCEKYLSCKPDGTRVHSCPTGVCFNQFDKVCKNLEVRVDTLPGVLGAKPGAVTCTIKHKENLQQIKLVQEFDDGRRRTVMTLAKDEDIVFSNFVNTFRVHANTTLSSNLTVLHVTFTPLQCVNIGVYKCHANTDSEQSVGQKRLGYSAFPEKPKLHLPEVDPTSQVGRRPLNCTGIVGYPHGRMTLKVKPPDSQLFMTLTHPDIEYITKTVNCVNVVSIQLYYTDKFYAKGTDFVCETSNDLFPITDLSDAAELFS